MPTPEVDKRGELAHAEYRARQIIADATNMGFEFVKLPLEGGGEDVREAFFRFFKQEKDDPDAYPIDHKEVYASLTALCKSLDYSLGKEPLKVTENGYLE